jgi:tetratricopeptide (TPR) repeat protein
MTGTQDQALADAKSALELSNRVPHQALELANSALKHAGEGDWETQAYAYAALGSSYASLGRHEEATRHVNEAQKFAFELRLTYVLARIHQARGWVAYSQDNSVLAFSDWQIAFDYFHQIRDMRGTAWIMLHYAANYASLGLLDHCIRCQISALDIVRTLGDADALVELKIDLAKSYVSKAWEKTFVGDRGFSQIDAQIATSLLLDVLSEKLENFAPSLVEKAFQYLGESLLIQDKPEEALPNLQLALKSSTRNGHYSSEARVQGATGYAYYLCGNLEKSMELLSDAIGTAPDATSLSDMALIHFWQSQVLEKSQNPLFSLTSLRAAIEFEKRVHLSRMERWARVHDLTLGINPSLVSIEAVSCHENDWVYSEADLSNHLGEVKNLLKEDPLTGVLCKAEALEAAQSQGCVFATIYEIQNLDHINRKFERAVGDEVLRHVASVLNANHSENSVVGRFSGNEFFVGTSEDKLDQAMKALNKFPWLAIDPELSVRIAYRRVRPDMPHLLAA